MKRGYGILMPVFSLPSDNGTGDFGPAAFRFVDLLADHGAAYWQILPLNPGNPQNGESPYFSVSAFAMSPLLISLEKLRDNGLLSNDEIQGVGSFSRRAIAYPQLRAAKTPLLEIAVSRFDCNAAYDEFCRNNRFWLDDYAVFEVLQNQYATSWTDWHAAFRDSDAGNIEKFAVAHSGEIKAKKIVQYFAYAQWRDLRRYCADRNISIIGDMPIYVALDSADTWSNPELFKLDKQRRPTGVSGVPPDYFSASGQLWNNPVYNWPAHEAEGFSWWVERMRHLLSLYDIVRIDHFRGLVQYWEIPSGELTAINGTWKDAPTYDLFDTLISKIKPFSVVCEDLGIITDNVRAAMKHYGFSGMKVLQFAFGDDDPANPYLPRNYDGNCLVYTGTHDNLPTLGWLTDVATAEERARIVRYTGRRSDDKETVWDLIELAMQSSAMVAVFPLQDVLTMSSNTRINDPAKLHGNWQWRWDPAVNPAEANFDRLASIGKKYAR
jgi:4-alpha-glucanotransferase